MAVPNDLTFDHVNRIFSDVGGQIRHPLDVLGLHDPADQLFGTLAHRSVWLIDWAAGGFPAAGICCAGPQPGVSESRAPLGGPVFRELTRESA